MVKGFLVKNRTAFTMLELVFVIVVLGIVASLALPRMERDTRQEAGDSILSAIRYTQHLALSDNVTDPNDAGWQREFWRFGVRTCTGSDIFYYIGSDKDGGGNINTNEAAVDLANGARLLAAAGSDCSSGTSNGVSENIFISHKYGIQNTNMFANCGGGGLDAARYIGFDHLGRPHVGFSGSTTPDYSSLMSADCNLTFQFIDGSADLVIKIEKETGYASIVGQTAS